MTNVLDAVTCMLIIYVVRPTGHEIVLDPSLRQNVRLFAPRRLASEQLTRQWIW
jgi:hypothetical protein